MTGIDRASGVLILVAIVAGLVTLAIIAAATMGPAFDDSPRRGHSGPAEPAVNPPGRAP